jgi:hypothetical protein
MHLTAAQGWLELGNHEEANEELELIDAPLRVSRDSLRNWAKTDPALNRAFDTFEGRDAADSIPPQGSRGISSNPGRLIKSKCCLSQYLLGHVAAEVGEADIETL